MSENETGVTFSLSHFQPLGVTFSLSIDIPHILLTRETNILSVRLSIITAYPFVTYKDDPTA